MHAQRHPEAPARLTATVYTTMPSLEALSAGAAELLAERRAKGPAKKAAKRGAKKAPAKKTAAKKTTAKKATAKKTAAKKTTKAAAKKS